MTHDSVLYRLRHLVAALLFVLIHVPALAQGGAGGEDETGSGKYKNNEYVGPIPDHPKGEYTYIRYDSDGGFTLEYFDSSGSGLIWNALNSGPFSFRWELKENGSLCFYYPSYTRSSETGKVGEVTSCVRHIWWRILVDGKIAGDPTGMTTGKANYKRDHCDPTEVFRGFVKVEKWRKRCLEKKTET